MGNIGIEEAAKKTGLSPKSIRMRIFRGTFPCIRLGKRVLIPERELEKYLLSLPGVSAEEALAKTEERLKQ